VTSVDGQAPGARRGIVGWVLWPVRTIVVLIWGFGRWTLRIVGLLVVVFVFAFYVFDTPKDLAYRYSVPGSEACETQWRKASALAPKKVDQAKGIFLDEGNDEVAAIDNDPELKTKEAFTCMLQKHVLDPIAHTSASKQSPIKRERQIGYNLAFLEFSEAGTPIEEGVDRKNIVPVKREVNGKVVEGKECFIERAGRVLPENCQLSTLLRHLSENEKSQNFVIAFIHGWRHDASIGDDNVKDVRVYAAHLASFLDYRCRLVGRYCNAVITAVYIGWRGARVNEQRFSQTLKAWGMKPIGDALGTLLAFPTLFDRKPVSERVAPEALSALRAIDEVLSKRNNGKDLFSRDRMIIFGHSLGGNMLASALRDRMVEVIRRHEPGTKLKPPIGDLIVLLNPASEASNWTALQRATYQRGNLDWSFNRSRNADQDKAEALYPIDQPPIYMALTAAATWPAGDFRETGKRRMRERAREINPQAALTDDCKLVMSRYGEYNDRADYDWATHDLFPAFRGDFRAAAETLDRLTNTCMDGHHFTNHWLIAPVLRLGAALLRNVPFMNTDFEQTRTIGHLDSFRPPFGVYDSGLTHAATRVGTTHELTINQKPEEDTVYGNAADPYLSECAIVDHWLWQARERQRVRFAPGEPWSNGDFWDTGYSGHDSHGRIFSPDEDQPNLTAVRKRPTAAEGYVESQFRHGLQKAGMDPIVAANDPFWNIRAVDTALHAHSGYVSYPLICAIHQLVMDDVASKPSH